MGVSMLSQKLNFFGCECILIKKTINRQIIKGINLIESQEKIYAWKPIEGLEDCTFTIHSATLENDGLKIILFKDTDPKEGLLLDFLAALETYRIAKKNLSMHLLKGPAIFKDDKKLLPAWSFFKLENSEYLKWASYQSNGLTETLGVSHYAILTKDWTIDVLSLSEPRIKLIETNN